MFNATMLIMLTSNKLLEVISIWGCVNGWWTDWIESDSISNKGKSTIQIKRHGSSLVLVTLNCSLILPKADNWGIIIKSKCN